MKNKYGTAKGPNFTILLKSNLGKPALPAMKTSKALVIRTVCFGEGYKIDK